MCICIPVSPRMSLSTFSASGVRPPSLFLSLVLKVLPAVTCLGAPRANASRSKSGSFLKVHPVGGPLALDEVVVVDGLAVPVRHDGVGWCLRAHSSLLL